MESLYEKQYKRKLDLSLDGENKESKAAPKGAKEAMYIVNGVAYPKSKLEKKGYDISKLKEYK
jgi:hypothetical protein